ncbi:MAG: hypothetical protein QG656_2779 [Candidatus Hydrogenedentes bacterium]|nr:hypothetical protein [Candidatus Hydrogenedentota bacterium]
MRVGLFRRRTGAVGDWAVLLGVLMLVLCQSDACARTVSFAGRDWTVRTGEGGPGPNNWSDSEESVWVDGDGLHLKIRNIDDVWHCAEVTSVLPSRYGMHTFYCASRVDCLDKNIVASPFLYKDDSHEIDIEFSTWKRSAGNNAQYVVQPYNASGHMRRFDMKLDGEFSTHSFNWLSDSIRFRSLHGHYAEPPAPEYVIQDWTYTGSDNPPESDGLRIHINLWLIGGTAPSDGKEAEFVVKNADLPVSLGEPDNE